MAKKKSTSTGKSTTKVTRITATDSATSIRKDSASKQAVRATQPKEKESSKTKRVKTTSGRRNPLSAFFGYFKGAWRELKQVIWPTRSATWQLTGAVLLFSAFFVVFIALLDMLFKYIFELILT